MRRLLPSNHTPEPGSGSAGRVQASAVDRPGEPEILPVGQVVACPAGCRCRDHVPWRRAPRWRAEREVCSGWRARAWISALRGSRLPAAAAWPARSGERHVTPSTPPRACSSMTPHRFWVLSSAPTRPPAAVHKGVAEVGKDDGDQHDHYEAISSGRAARHPVRVRRGSLSPRIQHTTVHVRLSKQAA